MNTVQDIIPWIYSSGTSAMIRDTGWVVPMVQAIHISAITVVAGSALVTELRFAGLIATDENLSSVTRRYLPWMWGALVVLLISGTILVLGEPERSLNNRVFWVKMTLVLCGFLLAFVFRRPWLVATSDNQGAPSMILGKAVALLSLCIWIAAIFSGRWIAYTL